MNIEQKFYTHFFSSLDKKFQKVKTIYFVADGFLHLDDISRWRLPNGDFWIEHQNIRRFSSPRDLLRKSSHQKREKFIALGGIDYGGISNKTNLNTKYIQRSIFDENGSFTELKYSRKEIKSVVRFFEGRKDKIMGIKASEHYLKNLSTPPYILHLATHAFYKKDKYKLQRPLTLSGLALASANQGRIGKKDKDGEDGILFAIEAVELNLDGTKLVTLSACETAQGEIDYSEGVYGLVQAFKIAGAENILMTLTEVNDKDALNFMKTFYRNWMQKPNQHPQVALRETKLGFIKRNKDSKFWSPYVLVETAKE